MQYVGILVRRVCAPFFVFALLMGITSASCATKEWELLQADRVSDGVAILVLSFSDSQHGWALTPFQLLQTSDGGKTWMERLNSQAPQMTFYSMTFASPTVGFIVGAQRKGGGRATLILRTEDGGRSWQEETFSVWSPNAKAPLQLNSVSFCDQTGWAVGSNVIVHTPDGGKSWEIQRRDNKDENLFSVTCLSPERVWVVGESGLILETKDAGQTWTHKESGTKLNLVRMRFFGEDGWIAGGIAGEGILLQTRNGGASWQSKQLKTSVPLLDIYIKRNGRVDGWSGRHNL